MDRARCAPITTTNVINITLLDARFVKQKTSNQKPYMITNVGIWYVEGALVNIY